MATRSCSYLLLVLAAASVRMAPAQSCPSCGPLSVPPTVVNGALLPNPNTSITPATNGTGEYSVTVTSFGATPLPAVLPPGRYQAWCGTSPMDGAASDLFTATSTPPMGTVVLSEINFILNHKQGFQYSPTVFDVQLAIWTVLGSMQESDLMANGYSAADELYRAASNMAQAAAQNPALLFAPAAGQTTVLVLLSSQTGAQHLLVELVNCGSIGDRVYLEQNGDNSCSNGAGSGTCQTFSGSTPLQPGINGVAVQMTDAAGQVFTTVTAPSPASYPYLPAGTSGWYQFTGLSCPSSLGAPAYSVQTPASLSGIAGQTVSLTPTQNSSNTATDSNGNSAVATLTPAQGSTLDETLDFGYAGTPAINISCPKSLAYATYYYTTDYSRCSFGISTQTACANSVRLPVTGGTPPYAYAASGLSPGISMDGATGILYGRPSASGTYMPTYTVTDSAGNMASLGGACSLVVKPQPVTAGCMAMTGQQGVPYHSALPASGGNLQYTYTMTAGSLPPGLTLNSDGSITGTPGPSAIGNYTPTIVVKDTSGNTSSVYTYAASCTIMIAAAPPAVACPSSSAYLGGPYSSGVAGSGGTPPYRFQLHGTLPPGLQTTATATALQIAGTPSTMAASPYAFTASLTDSTQPTPYTVTTPAACAIAVAQRFSIGCPAAAAASVQTPYTATVAVTGSAGPFAFAVNSGSLPSGVTISASAGTLSGTPATAGSYSFTVQVSDYSTGTTSPTVETSSTCTMSVGLSATCPSVTSGVQGQGFAASMTGIGAPAGATYTFSNPVGLPPGLTMDTTGRIAGVPTAAGTYAFTVTVVDSAGDQGTKSCSITIYPPLSAPCVTTSGVAVQGVMLAPVMLAATGGAGGPYTFSATGLPTGLTMSPAGTISGTPQTAGTFSYTITVKDAAGNSASSSCSISVNPPPAVTCQNVTGTVGSPITPVALTATGGAGGPYSFSAAGLPAGLTMSPSGAISGTPQTAGTFSYTVTVMDAAGNSGTASCSVAIAANLVAPPPISATCAGVSAVQGVAISPAVMTAAGGSGGPYTFTATGLPSGLAMSSSGTISGTPSATGTFQYTVTVKDSAGNTGTFNCGITVSSGQPPCSGTLTPIAYNLNNENSTSAGEIVWFNSHLTKLAGSVPTTDFQIYVQNGRIAFGTTTLVVPDAVLTFTSKAACASTSFDTTTNTWRTTLPLSAAASADEIFMAGLAYPLPANFAQNIKSATWSATVFSAAEGLQVTWQFGASHWLASRSGTSFPMSNGQPDYNGMMINPAHNAPACNYAAGDHAGAPEFGGRANVLTGGGSGGGGSNWTGSWSSTPPKTTIACLCIASGDTATIGFWHNQNGQALIMSLNGGSNATALGNWLAGQFPYLHGPRSANDLTGQTNGQVAAYYLTLFGGDKTGAQIMAGALAAYVTSSTLAGTAATAYGFNSSSAGTGGKTYNVGANGTAIGLTNSQSYAVMSLLQAVNQALQNGAYAASANAFNVIFSAINQTGDIA